MGARDVGRVRRALGRIEDVGERNDLVRGAVQAAAADDGEVAILAQILTDRIRRMGPVTALELLAALGWWMIEADRPGTETGPLESGHKGT